MIPIPVSLLHTTLEYLSHRPWREVNPLIQQLIEAERRFESAQKETKNAHDHFPPVGLPGDPQGNVVAMDQRGGERSNP